MVLTIQRISQAREERHHFTRIYPLPVRSQAPAAPISHFLSMFSLAGARRANFSLFINVSLAGRRANFSLFINVSLARDPPPPVLSISINTMPCYSSSCRRADTHAPPIREIDQRRTADPERSRP